MTQSMNTESPYLSHIRIAGWSLVALLLLLPFVAMQFSDEVVWTAGDFVVAGLMLGSVGLGFEFVARQTRRGAHRWASVIAIVGVFLLVWINGAVGIIGDEGNLGNLLYFGVLAVGLLGALSARFRSGGMALTMGAMGLAQIIALPTAWMLGWSEAETVLSPETLGVTALFVALWLASALFFRSAAQQESE